jgi:hypothetical protein
MSFDPGVPRSIKALQSRRKSLTYNMNTPPRSQPMNTTVPDAPKKPSAPPVIQRSEHDVKEFLAAISNFHQCEAIITSGDNNLEDTANSSMKKSSFY